MRVLVTGATGLVGRLLVERLLDRGDGVHVLSRSAEGARARLPERCRAFSWNPQQEPAPAASFEGVDAVVHLAGEPVVGYWTEGKKRRIRDSRVLGTRHLVDGLLEHAGPSVRLVSASAIGYYGHCGDDDVTEERPAAEDFLGRTSRQWEEESHRAAEKGHVVANPRIGIVLSRRGGALAAMLPAFRLGLGGRLGHGRQWWSWIHRGDLVDMILAAADGGWEGPFNATTPEPVRQEDFASALGRALGRPTFLPAPAWALRLLLGGFEVELLGSKRVLPARATAAGFRPRFATLDGALEDLLD